MDAAADDDDEPTNVPTTRRVTVEKTCDAVHAFVERHQTAMFLATAALGIILCFVPLMGTQPPCPISWNVKYLPVLDISTLPYVDDLVLQGLYQSRFSPDLWNVAAAVACIVISIPPVIDTVIDALPPWLTTTYIYRPRMQPLSKEVFRFTHLERMIFVVSTVINPVANLVYASSSATYNAGADVLVMRRAAHVLHGCKHVGQTLRVMPAMMLMARLSVVWTPLLAWSVQAVLTLASVLDTTTFAPVGLYCLRRGQKNVFTIVGYTLKAFCFSLGAMGAFKCLRQFLADGPLTWTSPPGLAVAERRFRGLVVGAHLTIALFGATEIIFMGEVGGKTDVQHSAKIDLVTFGLALMVFLVESRIRKNEVPRSLYAAADVTKRYAQHVEGELRVPLSTAIMGLRLLREKVQTTTAAADNDDDGVMDTLDYVQRSCVTVSTVIEGFLLFENTDLMEESCGRSLPARQMILAKAFVTNAVECGTTEAACKTVAVQLHAGDLTALPDGATLVGDVLTPAVPLTDSDLLLASRAPLEQALRTIVAYVIARAAAGSTLHVYTGSTPPRVSGHGVFGADAGWPTEYRYEEQQQPGDPAGEPRRRPSQNTEATLVLQLFYTGERMEAADTLDCMLGMDGHGEYVGLWAATAVVKVHGGSVRVVPRNKDGGTGGGAVVAVELPMISVDTASLPSVHESASSDSLLLSIGTTAAAAWQFRRGGAQSPATAVRSVGRNGSVHALEGASEFPIVPPSADSLRIHIDADMPAMAPPTLAPAPAQQAPVPREVVWPLQPMVRMERLSVQDSDTALDENPHLYSVEDG